MERCDFVGVWARIALFPRTNTRVATTRVRGPHQLPRLAPATEVNQEWRTLVDMQFQPVLPCLGFALESHDFVGRWRHQRHLARMSPHSFVCWFDRNLFAWASRAGEQP